MSERMDRKLSLIDGIEKQEKELAHDLYLKTVEIEDIKRELKSTTKYLEELHKEYEYEKIMESKS